MGNAVGIRKKQKTTTYADSQVTRVKTEDQPVENTQNAGLEKECKPTECKPVAEECNQVVKECKPVAEECKPVADECKAEERKVKEAEKGKEETTHATETKSESKEVKTSAEEPTQNKGKGEDRKVKKKNKKKKDKKESDNTKIVVRGTGEKVGLVVTEPTTTESDTHDLLRIVNPLDDYKGYLSPLPISRPQEKI
ncbi:uncharacterized protein [Antedon mediterranea]|uniref:uncharacterized protein n=1 Tax=Antedon mediterranea TaxID=105859 RepID=UPI003AF650F7